MTRDTPVRGPVVSGGDSFFNRSGTLRFERPVDGIGGGISGVVCGRRRTSSRFGSAISGRRFSGGLGRTFRTRLFCGAISLCDERFWALLVNDGVRKTEPATSARQT